MLIKAKDGFRPEHGGPQSPVHEINMNEYEINCHAWAGLRQSSYASRHSVLAVCKTLLLVYKGEFNMAENI